MYMSSHKSEYRTFLINLRNICNAKYRNYHDYLVVTAGKESNQSPIVI